MGAGHFGFAASPPDIKIDPVVNNIVIGALHHQHATQVQIPDAIQFERTVGSEMQQNFG